MITGSGQNLKLVEQELTKKAIVFSVLKKYAGGRQIDIEDIDILHEHAGMGVEIDGMYDWANSNRWHKENVQKNAA